MATPTTHSLSQNFKYLLNRSNDQQTHETQQQPQLCYLKKYYPFPSSTQKLNKLINYYTCQQQQRMITVRMPLIRYYGEKNKISYWKEIENRECNPEVSDSCLKINFCVGDVLTKSAVRSRADTEAQLRKIVEEMQRREKACGQQVGKSVGLNYVPFRSKGRTSKPMHKKIQKQLETIQRKWLNKCKYLRKQSGLGKKQY